MWNGQSQDNYDIYVKPIGAGFQRQLSTNPARDHSPAWSPDGTRIAFLRESSAGRKLLVVPAGGGPERELATSKAAGMAMGLAWHPDGKAIAFVDKVSLSEASGISLFSIDTRRKRALTTPPALSGGDSYPVFSPDGTQLAFIRNLDGQGVVHVVAASGGEPRLIGQNGWALAFVLAGLERNDRQQLNLRTSTGGGLGWRLVKSKNTQLSIRGGITFTNEQFTDGVELSSGEALGQVEWKTLQFGKVELSTDARFYPSLTRSGRYRIEYDSTMRVPLLSQLTWSLSLFDRFDSDPPLPVQRNDYGLVSAFGFTF